MAGGGARRGTLVHHYGTGHRRPAPRPRQPRDGTGSCGDQPAHQSLLDRRLQRRPLPCAIFGQALAAELIGRRTLMPHALETGHESGQMQTEDTLRPGAISSGGAAPRARARVPPVGVALLELSPEPRTEPERDAVAVFEAVVRRWFHGGEECWPDLNQTELWLIARELLAALRSAELEIRSSDGKAR
jgi:hypothetical protein